MFLITGLGNPGKEYVNTPHNAGYFFVDSVREYLLSNSNLQISDWKSEKMFLSEICKIKRDGELLGVLQKPLTYMNLSGSAVRLILKKFKVDKYILAHDDLDIPLGKYKIQEGKSPKGHNGVSSVESVLEKKDFLRVRLGIENRGGRIIAGEEYVLMPFSKKERAILNGCIQISIENLLSEYLEL